MILYLIGFRGVGKSSVGRELARRLPCPFVDTDREIERQAGLTIAEIFAEQGEPAFRDIEAAVVSALTEQNRRDGGAVSGDGDCPLVCALGGGAVLREATRRLIRRHGMAIWLKADATTLASRLREDSNSPSQRPPLTELDPDAEIRALVQQREPVYAECADYTVDSSELTLEEVVQRILQWYRDADNE